MKLHAFLAVAVVLSAARAEAQDGRRHRDRHDHRGRPERTEHVVVEPPHTTMYQYDAIGRRLVDARPAPVGRGIQVNITGLNPLCYDVERVTYTVKQVEVPAATAFLTALGYPATPSTPKEPPKAAATTDSAVAKGLHGLTLAIERQNAIANRSSVRGARAAGATVAESEAVFSAIEQAVRSAGERLDRAESAFSSLQLARRGAERLVEEVKGGAVCASNVPLEAFLGEWERAAPEARRALTDGDDALVLARSDQAAATAMLSALSDALDAFSFDLEHATWRATNGVRVSMAKGTIGALKSRSDALGTQLTGYGERLPGLLADLSESAALVSGARLAANQTVIVPVNDETERVDFTMRRVGRKGITGIEGKVIEDAWSIPVQRRFRFFLSAGFFVSRFRSADFERRLRPRADQPDSTYSTYIDVGGGTGTAVSPAIQANITVGPALALSAGVASRTVNKKVGLDFLMGGSLAFSDRFLFTLGWAYTRVERLLLPGTPAEVAANPVPANITDEAAVGEKRVLAPMIGVTFRIN
jgi:hypothetical protein